MRSILLLALAFACALPGTASAKGRGIVAVPGATHVALIGPAGRRIEDRPGVGTPTAFHMNGTTYVVAPAGTWRVEGEGVTRVLSADLLPKPRVTASVRRGRLSYSVTPIPGQKVTFLDDGRPLGRARGARGTLRFKPAAAGGRQRIVAVVSSYGLPRARKVVASYRARGAARPARVRHLRARWSGARLVASWARSAGAARYVVDVTLSEGTHVIVRRRGTRFTLPAASRRATVAVSGLGADGTRGRATRVTLTHRR